MAASQPNNGAARGLPEVLGVAAVMARYGYRDRRAARTVMGKVGAFRIGSGIYIYADDLIAYERQQLAKPAEHSAPPRDPRSRGTRRPSTKSSKPVTVRVPGWWREPRTDERNVA